VLAWTKRPTSPDVTAGMQDALAGVLGQLGVCEWWRVGRIVLGTTHATNAVVTRRGLGRVAVVRLGAPATTAVPPLAGWPADLAAAVAAGTVVVGGGHFADGRVIAPLDRDAVQRFLGSVAGEADAAAVTGVFSPAFGDQELEVAELVRAELGQDLPVSVSHEIGSIGLLERENATVLNAALYGVVGVVARSLDVLLAGPSLHVPRLVTVPRFLTQNDGTLMTVDHAGRYPVLTIGSGTANSLRGAAYLSRTGDAVVVDVGGTSTDVGVLAGGYPRESAAAADIGGVRTNFRMPDVLSLALGGGSVVAGDVSGPTVGPRSVGYRLGAEGLVFGGRTPTLTDAAVLGRRGRVGVVGPWAVPTGVRPLLAAALAASDRRFGDAVDQVGLGKADRPLVAVGGGAFLVPDDVPGAAEVLRPPRGDVAGAVGAAIALASARWDFVAPAGDGRRRAIDDACELVVRRAVQAGADPRHVEVVELTEVPLSYLPEPAVRVQVKAAGPLGGP
jgi:N-methylhydantoinase A/oxoprolinase/acetone carboxylase beta subunit